MNCGCSRTGHCACESEGLKEVSENCIFLRFSKHYWAWHVARIGDKFVQILDKKPEGTVPLGI